MYNANKLNFVHMFSVHYQNGGDLDLRIHADDSDVTLNISLNDGFTGGELIFVKKKMYKKKKM